MTTVPLSEAKDRLSALVDQAATTHDIVTITRHGRPAAVLMAAGDLEALHESLFWLSQAGVHHDVADADRERRADALVSVDEVRSELGRE